MLLSLINDFITCATYMSNNLRDEFSLQDPDLLKAYRHKIIPKEGATPDGVSWNFHGAGIYFEFDGGSIDFDFGPDANTNGFDVHRLHYFIEDSSSNRDKYPMFLDKDKLIMAFKEAIWKNIIYNPGTHPGTTNFYLRK